MGWKDTIKDAPKKSWRDTIVDKPAEKSDTAQTAVDTAMGVVTGLPLAGLAQKITAGRDALIDVIGSDKTLGQLYDENLAKAQAPYLAAKERSPTATTVGEIAGAIAAPNPASVAGRIGLNVADAATRQNDLGGAAKSGAVAGVTSGAIEAILPAAAKALSKSGKATAEWAEDQAVKSLNPTAVQKARLDSKDGVGRLLLDEGIVSPFATKKEMAERAASKLSEAGQEIGGFVKNTKGEINPRDVIDDFFDKTLAKDSQIATRKAAADAFLDNPVLNNLGKSPNLSMEAAQAEKMGLDDIIGNWEKQNLGAKDIYSRELRRALKEKMDDLAAAQGTDGVWKDLNKRYSNLADIKKVADKSAARNGANNALSLTDMLAGSIGGSAGAMAGGPIGAAVGAAGASMARQGVRKYGNQIAAVLGDKASKVLENPKYAKILESAAARGKTALAATHYVLKQQDPEYAAALGD